MHVSKPKRKCYDDALNDGFNGFSIKTNGNYPPMTTKPKRFQVGLSFPGEHRELVAQVAGYLAGRLGKEQVFYDQYHDAEIPYVNTNNYLQNTYHNDCELLVAFLCKSYQQKEWCGLEWRAFQDLIKTGRSDDIVLVRIDDSEIEGIYSTDRYISAWDHSPEKIADRILERLKFNKSQPDRPQPEVLTTHIPPQQRQREIDWLQNMLNRRFPGITALYVNLESEQRQQASLAKILPPELMTTTFIFRSSQIVPGDEKPAKTKKYSDILHAFRELSDKQKPRLAILGEPGAGKTFALIRILLDYAQKALDDVTAPIPLYLPLGRWTQEDQTLEDFVKAELGALGQDVKALLQQQRALLLLDALNEIPTQQREEKAGQVRQFIESATHVSSLISCRERDFQDSFHLPLDTLTILPLKPPQIEDLVHKYLRAADPETGEAKAEILFWQIAGGKPVKEAWLAWQQAGADFESFWSTEEIPAEHYENYAYWRYDSIRQAARSDTRSLLHLAENPYLLKMMIELFLQRGGHALPTNKGRLFADFVENLCNREINNPKNRHDAVPGLDKVKQAMENIALLMQRAGGMDQLGNVQTSLPVSELPDTLTPQQLDFACDANLLSREGRQVRFPHQLLQEYFAAVKLKQAIATGQLQSNELWPENGWWQRSGWEVVAELIAELCESPAELDRLIAWLAAANPDVAAEVWRKRGQTELNQTTLSSIQAQWTQRLTDIEKEPEPPARAAIGRALARFDLDRRPGVGLTANGLPDIAWVEIPAGPFSYQDEETLDLPAFYLARYTVTTQQYRVFIEDGGYNDSRWWQDLAEHPGPELPTWDFSNHPRETVSWYEAIAFTRWLSDRLGYAITLPTEQQWEKAARGTDGRLYTWPGTVYLEGYANIDETGNGKYSIGQTSPTGLYPQAQSPYQVLDLCGNVWEWCLNKYDKIEQTSIQGGMPRALRGGSWFLNADSARAAFRGRDYPGGRNFFIGFRGCCVSPINE